AAHAQAEPGRPAPDFAQRHAQLDAGLKHARAGVEIARLAARADPEIGVELNAVVEAELELGAPGRRAGRAGHAAHGAVAIEKGAASGRDAVAAAGVRVRVDRVVDRAE